MIRRVVGIYFSPIGGTARMTAGLTDRIAGILDDCSPEKVTHECYDLLRTDTSAIDLDDETVAVIGMPVYVGKVPLPALRMMKKIDPRGAMTIAAVSYGARTYGNALFELQHHAEDQGFKVVGAGAFSIRYKRRHGVSENMVDESGINAFGNAAAAKIKRLAGCEIEGLRVKPAPLEVVGRLPVHGVSRISPAAAAMAQTLLDRLNIRKEDSEWYL